MRPAQSALAAVLREHAIEEGEYTLSSGGTSSWYLDGRKVTFRGDCFALVGDAIVEALAEGGISADDYDSVGGMAVGAVPVALAVALATGKRSFAVRKEAKAHGVAGRVAGPMIPGDRVLVVEDTATTGASVLQAIDVIEELGSPVVAVSLLLDRGSELAPVLVANDLPYLPVLTAPDLGYEPGS